MNSKRASVRWGWERTSAEGIISSSLPLIPPAPRSAMFFPLVVLIAVLPGLYALSRWDLTPPGPWWGLRGLAVLNGQLVDQSPARSSAGSEAEAWAYRTVAFQPPLYAWLEAAALSLSPDRSPLATVLPSYVAGALVVILVYLHGRLWRGPGLGLVAAVLIGFNRDLLLQMQQSTPTTLGMAGILLALLCYCQHLRPGVASPHPWTWHGGLSKTVLGGLSLGLALLAVGGFGLVCAPVILLHQVYLGSESAPSERPRRWWRTARSYSSLAASVAALGLALALAVPWHVQMYSLHGNDFIASLLVPPESGRSIQAGLLGRIAVLAPVTLPLALFGAVRLARAALRSDADDPAAVGGLFWVIWLLVAGFVPAVWPSGPRSMFDLFLLVALSLLAAQTITDISNRRIPVRVLVWLVPTTLLAVAWWASAGLRELATGLVHGQKLGAVSALGLHIGLDALIAAACFMALLLRWAKRHDARQRLILGAFLSVVLATTATTGIREVRFRHRETKDLLTLRDVVLHLHQARPFTLVAVVWPAPTESPTTGPSPGGRLRFILRSALPDVPEVDLTHTDDLLNLSSGQHLVILVGDQRMPYALQAQLGLWAIHPGRSGVLDAFATVRESDMAVRR